MSSARQDFSTALKAACKFSRTTDPPSESIDEDAGLDADEHLPSNRYEYTELTKKASTRLISLRPGRRKDPIICQLKEISLDESPNEYDALSYVWGPPGGGSTAIQVDEGMLDIGPGLYCALKYLRYIDRPRVLWVDAICINQSSIAERNVQVPLMREIYQNAACTVCFLGPTTKKSAALYAMLEDLAEEKKAMENEDPVYSAMDNTLPAIINHLPIHPVKTPLVNKYLGDSTIVDIAKCEWWHRAWTVQELMLSANAVLVTGRYTISWEKFCDAVDHGFNMQIWGPVFLGFSINPVVIPYMSMRVLINRYRHPHLQASAALDLFHLLVNCRHRESTDPRDKVYAVLGLLRSRHPETLNGGSSDALDVEMDYSHDVDYVYRKMSGELILKKDTLDVLGICPNTTRQLPSWVTDWSVTDLIGSCLMQDSLDQPRTTHASKHTKVGAIFSDDGASMTIRGYELTSIAATVEALPVPVLKSISSSNFPQALTGPPPGFAVLSPNTETGYSMRIVIKLIMTRINFLLNLFVEAIKLQYEWFAHDMRHLMLVFHALFAWENFAATEPPTNPGERPDAIYWQTLCAGTYKDGSVEETEAIFKAWYDLVQPLRKFTARHPWIIQKSPLIGIIIYMKAAWTGYGEFWPYMTCSQRRRLGRAANGWLCLLPKDTIEGDIIILAKGGRVPLVIRQREDGHNIFVGEAYVHGIMDGEAFDEGRCVGIEIW